MDNIRQKQQSEVSLVHQGTIPSPWEGLPDTDTPPLPDNGKKPMHPKKNLYPVPPDQIHETVELEINTTLENIPDNQQCEICEGAASKTLIPYKLAYVDHDGLRFMAKCEVPGYRCTLCEVGSYDLNASVEVLEAAAEAVRLSGDETTLSQVVATFNVGKRRLALHR